MTRTVLVTGANRGLGLETVRQLGERGDHVLLGSRDEASGRAAADALNGDGLPVEYRQLDVTNRGDIDAITEEFATGDPLDVLVNNAAVSLNGFDSRVVRDTLAVNFYGAMNLTDALLPRIAAGGAIVNVSSGMGELSVYGARIQARLVDPDLDRDQLRALVGEFVADVAAGRHSQNGWPSSAYRVSKAALNAYTRILSRELAPRGIRVNSVCPGWVRTRMGGVSASRDVKKGAESIVWAAILEGPTSGGFYRDGHALTW